MAKRPRYAKQIIDHCFEQRITQAKLADKTGLGESTLSKILAGVYSPSPKATKAISRALRLSKEDRQSLHQMAAKYVGYEI